MGRIKALACVVCGGVLRERSVVICREDSPCGVLWRRVNKRLEMRKYRARGRVKAEKARLRRLRREAREAALREADEKARVALWEALLAADEAVRRGIDDGGG